MSDAEGAYDDIQVGETAGVNDPGDIPWRTAAWRAGVEDVGPVKTATRVGGTAPNEMMVFRGIVRGGMHWVRATKRTWGFSSPESRSCCGTRQREKVPALRRGGGRRVTKKSDTAPRHSLTALT